MAYLRNISDIDDIREYNKISFKYKVLEKHCDDLYIEPYKLITCHS